MTSLNPVPNAQVCVYLTIHIIKLQLQSYGILKVYLIFEFEPCDYLLLFNGKKLLWWFCDCVEYELQNTVWNS
jgi:hypothetical protein